MSSPRISLITPSYQQAAYLEECIASAQSDLVEHIIVDGGSTDGSKAIIERNASRFAWWCSEKDGGQSDAINKGLAHATGDIFGWINSDDALLPSAAERVSMAFQADPDLLVFGGRISHRDAQGERASDQLNGTGQLQLFADPVINQPATFYRMDVVREIGGVDPALRYVMDLELWWQVLFRHGTRHVRFEDTPLAMFRLHNESKTVTQHSGFLLEMASLLHALSERSGNEDVAQVIALGYPERRTTRGIPASGALHHAMVRAMAVHFLLKWHGHIHDEAGFRMMKALQERAIPDGGCRLLPGMEERWAKARARVQGASWQRFRIRRKLRHLFG
jgi:hypothetical protein